MEEWNDDVFLNKVKRERERERREREREEKEREEKIKCHEMFGDRKG
jgi:hypothetical protein